MDHLRKYEIIIKYWQDFGSVPVDNNDNIEISWYGYAKGTSKLDIWQWFDDVWPNGVIDLLKNYTEN